jgi:hypothetical protein
MASNRKYEKYFSETGRRNAPVVPTRVGKVFYPIYYDIRASELTPHFIEAGLNYVAHVGGYGEGFDPNQKYQRRSLPHKHAFVEAFHWISLSPDNTDDLGGTVEFWLGEGDEAETCVVTRPAVTLVPAGVVHFPLAFREIHRPFLTLTVLDTPINVGIQTLKVPLEFKAETTAEEYIVKLKKYKECFNERDITEAAVFPSHKGKSHVVLQHDYRQNQLTPHYIEVNLIYGSGIGWGCGDMMEYPNSQMQSLPHFHGVSETYAFISTDKDNLDDLGGTVEFWIGEGREAEQYIITKPTVVHIPPSIVHLPIYIREVHNPFVLATILNTPLWAGFNTNEFPTGFNHIVENK